MKVLQEEIFDKPVGVASAGCTGCGRSYAAFGLGIVLPDSQWRQINPTGGALCPDCIAQKAALVYGAVSIRAVIEVVPTGMPERLM